jgi:hypothetical protein
VGGQPDNGKLAPRRLRSDHRGFVLKVRRSKVGEAGNSVRKYLSLPNISDLPYNLQVSTSQVLSSY